MESLQAILAFIVGIASIWGAVLCCKVACCCNNNGQVLASGPIVPMQGPQQVVVYSQQQQQQQGGQHYPYPPGSYPQSGYPGYPGYPAPMMPNNSAPMMPNQQMGVVNSGYVNHSMHPGSNNPPREGFINQSNNPSAPPGYDETKG